MNKYKKSIMLFAAVFFVSLQAFSQKSPVDEFFNRYANDNRFTLISVGPQMTSLFGSMSDLFGSMNEKQLGLNDGIIRSVHSIKSLRMLTTDSATTNAEHKRFYREVTNNLDISHYEELMNIRDKDDNINCFAVRKNDRIVEIIMVICDDDSFTLMDIMGDDLDINSMTQMNGQE